MTCREFSLLIVLSLVGSASATAQEAPHVVTNADVVNMAKSGVGDQTIILMIQKGTPKFDTSSDAVIGLKKAGVSDAVLNAMLSAPSANGTSADGPPQDCAQSLDGVLAAIGVREKLLAVHSLKWSGKETIDSASGHASFSSERVTVIAPV